MIAGAPPVLWYENDAGERWIPPVDYDGAEPPPPGFRYQHSRFPFYLRHTVLVCEGDRSSLLMAGEQSAPAALVLAMARPSLLERARQVLRYGRLRRSFEPKEAYMVAAIACECGMNSLAHEYGLAWGYRRGSEEWHRSRTSCEMCGTAWPPLNRLPTVKAVQP